MASAVTSMLANPKPVCPALTPNPEHQILLSPNILKYFHTDVPQTPRSSHFPNGASLVNLVPPPALSIWLNSFTTDLSCETRVSSWIPPPALYPMSDYHHTLSLNLSPFLFSLHVHHLTVAPAVACLNHGLTSYLGPLLLASFPLWSISSINAGDLVQRTKVSHATSGFTSTFLSHACSPKPTLLG